MAAMPHPSCLLCLEMKDGSLSDLDAAGPSVPARPSRRRKHRRRRLNKCLTLGLVVIAASSLNFDTVNAETSQHDGDMSMVAFDNFAPDADLPPSLSSLIRKRQARKRQSNYGPNQDLEFSVNVTPPTTCQPMNITFDPRAGSPPFTIFVGFDNWYPYTISLPSTYADPGVATWFYQFGVPVFRPVPAGSAASPTPITVVVVSDSTGNLMNSSSFQTVVEKDTSCAGVTGNTDFTFYNDPTITTCSPVAITWERNATTQPAFKDPLDIFILRELAPPIHIPVPNSSALTLNYTVTLTPGSNIMIAMTDKGGNGGISGENTVGGSEYIGEECLSQAASSTLPIAIPSPTATLSGARMPDYTAMVSSTLTSNGVVSTSVAVETYRHGSQLNTTSLGKGSIAGVAVGILIGAAVLAAFVSWCIWRKRTDRRNLRWDVPRSAEGELSKLNTNGPIDERFLRNQSKAMQREGSAGVAMLATTSPTSEFSSEERDLNRRQPPFTSSENNSYLDSPLRPNHSPSWNGSLNRYTNISGGITQYSDAASEGQSPNASSSIPMSRRISDTDSIVSNPFGNSHAVSNAPRSYRQPFNDHSGGVDSEGESLAMTPTRFHSSARIYSESAASLYESDQRYGVRSASNRTTNPTYVQHSDGGLLMDDRLDEDDVGDHIELPPQYDAVPRRAAAASATSPSNSRISSGNHIEPEESDLAVMETMRSISRNEEGDQDESEFWRSPPSNHHRRLS